MLDASDTQNLANLTSLRRIVEDAQKPIVFWLGAGTSAWCGYPLWNQLAESMHARFRQTESKYDKTTALKLLQGSYPEFFQYCKDLNPRLFNSYLANSLAPRPATPLYQRYIRLLSSIQPVQALTTNVDEALEKNLADTVTVQNTDIERLYDLIPGKTPFLCKLHGTSGSITSTVFTKSEYSQLLTNRVYLKALESIFTQSVIVFIGYGLADEYVISTLAASEANKPLFGTGPHFLVTSMRRTVVPQSILQITYSDGDESQHRSAMIILDAIRWVRETKAPYTSASISEQETQSSSPSSYYVPDFVTEGIWVTSQNVGVQHPSGSTLDVVLGQGFVESEIPQMQSTALHDLALGLICFDLTYLPLWALKGLHQTLGSESFWKIFNSGAVRLVHLASQPAIIYANASEVANGDVGIVSVSDRNGQPQSVIDIISSQIVPVTGQENAAADMIASLQHKIEAISEDFLVGTPPLIRGSLLQPSLRDALSLSEAILPTSIPRWNLFPVMRLAHLLTIGTVCERLGVGAARICWGGECLVGPAFGIGSSQDWASQVASYTLSGRFNADIGALIGTDAAVLHGILRFRESNEGISLRREIKDQLSQNAASDFMSSVNAGLNRNIPAQILDDARERMVGLLVATPQSRPGTRVVWNNFYNSDSTLKLWRKRSADILRKHCQTYGIRPKDLCPCQSGEKLRDCCGHSLSLQL